MKRPRYRDSSIRDSVGHLGESRNGTARPMFPDALQKCRCGATLRGPLDVIIHTSGTGVCTVRLRDAGRERCAL